MKQLKEYISEGILDDIETTLSIDPYKKLYPIPTIKDFKKGYWNESYVNWECQLIVKDYVNKFDGISEWQQCFKSDEHIVGLQASISSKDKMISVGFCTNNSRRCMLPSFKGIGDVVETFPKGKKEIIEFFKRIVDNPDYMMGKLVELHDKHRRELEQYGVADCVRLKDIK